MQRAVREIDASLPVYNIRTMAEHIERNLFLRKIPARMFLVIAPLLLALVAIGIYAVVSYTVSQRTTEIGVRIAHGRHVESRREADRVGRLAGGVGGIDPGVGDRRDGGNRTCSAAGPGAWTVLIAVPALLFAVAAFSCWLPARRATTVDPVVALRAE